MYEVFGVAMIPLIIGLVAVAKKTGVPTKALPALSLLLGVGAGVVYASNGNLKQGVLVGLMFGLSASGLYSGSKTVFEKDGDNLDG